MFIIVTDNFNTIVKASEIAVELARFATQVSIDNTYMVPCVSSSHATLSELTTSLSTEITFVNAQVIGLTSMGAIVEAALDAQQLTLYALQFAKLYIAFQIDSGAFKIAPKILHACVACLETSEILRKPSLHMIGS